MTFEEKEIQERIKIMREDELINFIRVDVIPQLESLATRLESYVEDTQGQGPEGGQTTDGGSSEPPKDGGSSQRDAAEGLPKEGGDEREVRGHYKPRGNGRLRGVLAIPRSLLLRNDQYYRGVLHRS